MKRVYSYVLAGVVGLLLFVTPFAAFALEPWRPGQSVVPNCSGLGGTFTAPCNFSDFLTLINNVLAALIYVFAVPGFTILFSVAGFFYLTARSPADISKAKQLFLNAIIGFGIIIIAWLLVSTFIDALLDPTYFGSDRIVK